MQQSPVQVWKTEISSSATKSCSSYPYSDLFETSEYSPFFLWVVVKYALAITMLMFSSEVVWGEQK